MSRVYTLKRDQPGPAAPPDGRWRDEPIDFAKELNPEQWAAVTAPPGQALVLAGAGSGKTRTLTYRVAYLLENAIAPQNILLLTFTNKSAREMIERVETLLPGRTGGLWSGTFHSICNRILRRTPEPAGLMRNFTILDSEDAKSLLTKVIKENPEITGQVERATGDKFPKAPVIGGMISLAVNTRTPLEEIVARQFSSDENVLHGITRIGHLYDQKKRKANSVDFDDLMTRTLELFAKAPDILADYQHQFQFILVDEYQDTNPVQSEIIDALAGEHGSVMVVGDDAQSIYSWRGADFQNIISFPERFPTAQVFKIETNYRSTPEILNLANSVIKLNVRQFAKVLRPACPSVKQGPVLAALYTPEEQAFFVAQRMRELNEEEGIDFTEMAVLYRAHFQSMDMQLQLTQSGIPFTVTSGLRFFESAHLKDFSAFLKWAVNPRDETAFDRIVQLLPGVGATSAQKMWVAWLQLEPARTGTRPASYSTLFSSIKVPTKAAKDWEQLGFVFDEFIDATGQLVGPAPAMRSVWEGVYKAYLKATYDNFESRCQDVEQFMRFGERFKDIAEMLTELSLLAGPEAAEKSRQDKQPEGVTLSSIHQAKGLEWKVVFIIWLTEGMFPNLRAVESQGTEGLEEERRLFYVALTRAREQLYLLYPRLWPKAYSGDTLQSPSSFLKALPPGSVEEWRIGR
jgi:DNA helicase II / ATP-dependent DNA helicase PcrA